MSPTECRTSLLDNLTESIHYALDLKQILDDERNALESKDSTSLHDAARCKQICVNKLDDLDHTRRMLSKNCGFDGRSTDIAELLAWCDDGHEITAIWAQFLDIAQTCSEMNDVNGAVIRVRQVQINDAIDLLRDGARNGNTYGPSGQSSAEHRARTLAEA